MQAWFIFYWDWGTSPGALSSLLQSTSTTSKFCEPSVKELLARWDLSCPASLETEHFDWFPCFPFSGLHRSKERHEGYVCNEIHEQECLHKEGCREKRASGIGNSQIPGAPISCQFVVRFSRRGRYVYGCRPTSWWWHPLPFAAGDEIRRIKGEIISMRAWVSPRLFAEQKSYTQVMKELCCVCCLLFNFNLF